MKELLFPLLLLCISTGALFSQNIVPITDGDLPQGDNFSWTSNNVYLIQGIVNVKSGSTLTINAGTVIKGAEAPNNDDPVSMLIIQPGAKIIANGSVGKPIIFTAESDDLTNDGMFCLSGGLWGGLYILGNAPIDGESAGIIGLFSNINNGFGGTNAEDDSGVLKYVSVRYAGKSMTGLDAGAAVFLGGVGNGTEISHLESYASSGAGIAFVGGTVNSKYVASNFSWTYGFYWDRGFVGNGQYWFAIMPQVDNGNSITAYHSSGTEPGTVIPSPSNPEIYNATYIGSGLNTSHNTHALLYTNGGAGSYTNSIFIQHPICGLQLTLNTDSDDPSSPLLLQNGTFAIRNNIWFDVGEDTNGISSFFNVVCDDSDNPNVAYLINHLNDNENTIVDPGIRNLDWPPATNGLDPLLFFGSPAFNNLASLPDGNTFFDAVQHKGAFGDENWMYGWTGIDACSYLYRPDIGIALTVQDVSCAGQADGAITASISGGVPPYSVSWSNGATDTIITNLSAGFYLLTVTDNGGTTVITNATVNEPESNLQLGIDGIEPDYPINGPEGTISVLVDGGTPPYVITLTGPSPKTQNLSEPGVALLEGLAQGDYLLQVRDTNDCLEEKSAVVSDGCEEFFVEGSTVDVVCAGDASGEIITFTAGGVGPYNYDWNIDALDGNSGGTGLLAGLYELTVTDAAGCVTTFSRVISEPEAISVECTLFDEPQVEVFRSPASDFIPPEHNNDLRVSFSGGVPPYTITLVGTAPYNETRTSNASGEIEFYDLPEGNYILTIRDGQNCSENCNFSILPPQGCYTIQDQHLVGGETYTLEAGYCYLIDGLVYLEKDGILNIEPGVVIKGMANPSTGDPISALIIAPGAQIRAQGTPDSTILFTAEADDPGSTTDLDATDRGLWGGLVILGNGILANDGSDPKPVRNYFAGQAKSSYGSNSDGDNSGILSYVSIRHAGAAFANGTNGAGLALAGVGSGTQLNHIEVFASAGDGIQLFGGRAGLKKAVSAFSANDGFALDQGYMGKGQFWFVLQGTNDGANAVDVSGNFSGQPVTSHYTRPTIFNATFIGRGSGAGGQVPAVYVHNAGGGEFSNSLVTQFGGAGIEVEDVANPATLDSWSRLDDDTQISSQFNVWWDFANGNELNSTGVVQISPTPSAPSDLALVNQFRTFRNKASDPKMKGVSRSPNGGLDPRLEDCVAFKDFAAYPTILSNGITIADPFYEAVNYKGAFDGASSIWAAGWTGLSEFGYFPANFPEADTTSCTQSPTDSSYCMVTFDDALSPQAVEEELELIKEEKGVEPIDSCHCVEGQPRIYLYAPEAGGNIELLTSRQGSGSGSNKDTSGLRGQFLIEDFRKDGFPRVYCLGLQNPPVAPANAPVAKVAIIDSGLDLHYPGNPNPTGGHPNLKGLEWQNPGELVSVGREQVDDDGNCLIDDLYGWDFYHYAKDIVDQDGHGTLMAGIIAEGYPSDIDLQMLNLKMFHNNDGTVFDLICSIHYAIDKGADVINLSLGYFMDFPNRTLYEALKRAEDHGVFVIASSGNDTINLDNPIKDPRGERWPAAFRTFQSEDEFYQPLKNLIVVGALDDEGIALSTYGNVGPRTVNVVTRGTISSTISTFGRPISNGAANGPFEVYAGTSMSAAVVTKLISIIRARQKQANGLQEVKYDEIIEAIHSTVDPIRGRNASLIASGGSLNIDSTLHALGLGYHVEQGSADASAVTDSDVLPNAKIENGSMIQDSLLFIQLGDGKKLYRNVTFVVSEQIPVEGQTQGIFKEVYRHTCPVASRIVWNMRLNDGSLAVLNKQYHVKVFQEGRSPVNLNPPTFSRIR